MLRRCGYVNYSTFIQRLAHGPLPTTLQVAYGHRCPSHRHRISAGFETADELARKMNAAFNAGEALLSAQTHYDWGLRARMAAVRAAADASRREAAQPEAVALLQGLRSVLAPGLALPDRKILDGVLADVFPGVSAIAPEAEAFGDALRDACEEMSLQLFEPWVAKVRALHVQLL